MRVCLSGASDLAAVRLREYQCTVELLTVMQQAKSSKVSVTHRLQHLLINTCDAPFNGSITSVLVLLARVRGQQHTLMPLLDLPGGALKVSLGRLRCVSESSLSSRTLIRLPSSVCTTTPHKIGDTACHCCACKQLLLHRTLLQSCRDSQQQQNNGSSTRTQLWQMSVQVVSNP